MHDIERKYRRGLMSEDERYANVIKTWNDTTAALRGRVLEVLPHKNPIYMMTNSGARGSISAGSLSWPVCAATDGFSFR